MVLQAAGRVTTPTPPAAPLKVPMQHVVWAGTVLALALLVSMTVLAWNDKSTEELTRVVNTIFNFVTLLVGGGAFVYSRNAATNAAAATENSAAAAVQTNGGLDERIQAAVMRAIEDNRGTPGGTAGYTTERR